MNKTKIEWCDFTWNPIKGLCPVGCWYCYARKMYKRFHLPPSPTMDVRELYCPISKKIKSGSRIFVCSTFELFHPVADEMRDAIFSVIEQRPDLTFIILTKMPERIDRPMPNNVWLGVSVTNRLELYRIDTLSLCQTATPFVSFEPLLASVVPPNGIMAGLRWAIVGRLTGHGHKNDPSSNDLTLIHNASLIWEVPIFLKNNLRNIWGGPLIQEYPHEGGQIEGVDRKGER